MTNSVRQLNITTNDPRKRANAGFLDTVIITAAKSLKSALDILNKKNTHNNFSIFVQTALFVMLYTVPPFIFPSATYFYMPYLIPFCVTAAISLMASAFVSPPADMEKPKGLKDLFYFTGELNKRISLTILQALLFAVTDNSFSLFVCVGAGFAGWWIQVVIGNLALNSRNVNQNSPLSSDRMNSLASEMIVASNLDSLEIPSQSHDLSSFQREASPSMEV